MGIFLAILCLAAVSISIFSIRLSHKVMKENDNLAEENAALKVEKMNAFEETMKAVENATGECVLFVAPDVRNATSREERDLVSVRAMEKGIAIHVDPALVPGTVAVVPVNRDAS